MKSDWRHRIILISSYKSVHKQTVFEPIKFPFLSRSSTKKRKKLNQNAWSKVKCDSLLFKKDDVFITLTFASVHLNSHVPLSVPLFGPKPNKACSDVLLQIVLCDCVGAEATLEHLQWQKLSHITSINSGINHWFSPDHTSLRPRSNVERFMRRTKL